MTTTSIPLSHVDSAPRNANVMDKAMLALLTNNMKERMELGDTNVLQPILVRPKERAEVEADQRYEIVDGHHRAEAAREAGYFYIGAVVRDMSDEEAARVAIGMNRIRGELDLSIVGDIFADMADDGIDPKLFEQCGFSIAEIDALIASATDHPDEELPPEMEPRAEPKAPVDENGMRWDLEVVFAERAQRDRVRRVAKKLGQGDLAAGLLRLADAEDGESELDVLLDAAMLALATRGDSEALPVALRDLGKVCKKINKRRATKEN